MTTRTRLLASLSILLIPDLSAGTSFGFRLVTIPMSFPSLPAAPPVMPDRSIKPPMPSANSPSKSPSFLNFSLLAGNTACSWPRKARARFSCPENHQGLKVTTAGRLPSGCCSR
ncbi:hypothetical protein FQZ97_1177340 [compost metagenome]